jgi:hypothetical protein
MTYASKVGFIKLAENTHKAAEKIMFMFLYKTLRLSILMTIAGLIVFLIMKNQGRIGSYEDRQQSALSIVHEYVSKSQNKGFTCKVVPVDGFPKRYPKKLSDIYMPNQEVWSFTWVCKSGKENIDGILVVFADGNTVWSGTSSTRGDLSTEEY